MVTSLTPYGTATPSSTVATANTLVTGTGAGAILKTTLIGTSTGYGEIWSQGNAGAWPAAGSLGGVGPHGWLLDTTLLENNTLLSGNFTVTHTLRVSVGSITADLYERVYIRSSGGVYTQIGSNLVKSGVTIQVGAVAFAWPATSLPLQAFGVGDKLYRQLDMHILTNSTGSGVATIQVSMANSASLGVASQVQLVTQGYTAGGGGGGGGGSVVGGLALATTGSGVSNAHYDTLRVTQYPDPSMSLANMGRVGSSLVSWNATLPGSATTLGVLVSTDGVNFSDMSQTNGGPLPGIASQQDPWQDTFSVDNTALYQSTIGYAGSVSTWTLTTSTTFGIPFIPRVFGGTLVVRNVAPTIGPHLTATGGARGIFLYSSMLATDIDLLCDMDESDAGGLVWSYSDSGDYYSLAVADASASIGTPNRLTLYKTVAGVQSQLAQATIAFTRLTPHRIRATMLSGAITVTMDGVATFPYTGTDTFARADQGTWGIGSGGEKWTLLTPNTPTLTITSNSGTLTGTAQITNRQLGTNTTANQDLKCRISFTNTADNVGVALRIIGGGASMYRIRINSNSLGIGKYSGGAFSGIASTAFTANAGTFYWLRATVQGSTLQAKIWQDGSGEPGTWTLTATDTSISGPGGFGISVLLGASGNTDTFDNFSMTPLSTMNTIPVTYLDATPLPAGSPGLVQNAASAARYDGRGLLATLDLGLGVSTIARFYQFWAQPQGALLSGNPPGDTVTSTFVYTQEVLNTTDNTVSPQVSDMTIAVFGPQIGAGALIPSASYVNTYNSANMDDLKNKSNYGYNVDKNFALSFLGRTAIPAPWLLVAPDTQIFNLHIENANDAYSNRQILTGVIGTFAVTEPITGNNQAKSFPLSYPIAPNTGPPQIKLNTLPQAVAQKGASGADWYYDVQFKGGTGSIAQDGGNTPLSGTDVGTVSYTAMYITQVQRDNLAGQAALAALEGGGTGIVENVTDVSALNLTVPAANAYGDMLNTRYGIL